MIVLHGGYVPPRHHKPVHETAILEAGAHRFFFWAEKIETDKTPILGSNVEVADDAASPPMHPYLAGSQDLFQILGPLPLNLSTLHPYQLLLPSANNMPVSVWGDTSLPSDAATLEVWTVAGVYLPHELVLSVFAQVRRLARTNPQKLFLAPDFAFWMQAGDLALDILQQGQYLPQVEAARRNPHVLAAAWSICDEAVDLTAQVTQLAAKAPPATVAYLHRYGATFRRIPHPPEKLLEDFLRRVVDKTVTAIAARAKQSTEESEAPITQQPAHALVEDWLRLLQGQRVDTERHDPKDINQLREEVSRWQDSITMPTPENWGICLTAYPLEEAAESGEESALLPESWELEIFLTNLQDPSIMIPAEGIIHPDDGLDLPAKDLGYSQYTAPLRTALIKAAKAFPPLERAYQKELNSKIVVSADTFSQLLQLPEAVSEAAGLSLRVPSTMVAEVKLKAIQGSELEDSQGKLALEKLLNFDWQLAIDDVEVSQEEFARMVALRLPILRIRDRFVTIPQDRARRLLSLWNRVSSRPLGVAEALELKAHSGADVEIEFAPNSWLAKLEEAISGEATWQPLPQPQGFNGVMRPYQLRGYAWLKFMQARGIGACLADDMGLGKTIQVIALLLSLYHGDNSSPDQTGEQVTGPTLIVCPTSVIGNWRREIQRFAPALRLAVHYGPHRPTGVEMVADTAEVDVVLTTYGLIHRDRNTLQQVHWAGIVLDEAQNIKNPHTKTAQGVRNLTGGFRIALTGTPIENNLVELWSIMHFLNPGFLGSLEQFRQRYVNPIQRRGDRATLRRLQRLIRPFILRRLKTDPEIVPELPEKIESKIYCSLTSEQAQLYQAVVDDLTRTLETSSLSQMRRRGLVLRTLTHLKQIVNHPSLFLKEQKLRGRSGKVQLLLEMLTEVIAQGEKALIFTQYAAMGRLLQDYLRSRLRCEVPFLHGGVPQEQRTAMVERFQSESVGQCPIFILSLRAGGTGLNLTAATHVFHFDRWWNPAVENQATDRAFRIGQQHRVQVHKFICGGTLEERIDEIIESKRELADSVVGAGESWLTELSNEELRDVITLRSPDLLD